MIDLHLHSTASDGQYTPEQIVCMAYKTGVSALSLTDHDTISGIAEGEQAAKRCGIYFIPGIEISVSAPDICKEFHLLGYGFDPSHPVIREMNSRFFKLRQQRAERIFEFLSEQKLHLEYGQVEKYAKNGLLARPHFARALVEVGYVSTVREAFDRYLATPDFDKIERPKPSLKEGITCILESGGIPVLAHPVQLKLCGKDLEQLIHSLKKIGLKGIECYYSTHSPEQTAYYLSIAEKENMIITGGSDFHGEKIKPEIRIGTGIRNSLQTPENLLVKLKKDMLEKNEHFLDMPL